VDFDDANLSADRGRHAPAAATNPWTLGTGEAFIVPRDEMRFDLLHGIQCNANDDHQTGTAEAEGNTKVVGKEVGEYAND
jgi:hypothetical protein